MQKCRTFTSSNDSLYQLNLNKSIKISELIGQFCERPLKFAGLMVILMKFQFRFRRFDPSIFIIESPIPLLSLTKTLTFILHELQQ